jgi:hypothetical protein
MWFFKVDSGWRSVVEEKGVTLAKAEDAGGSDGCGSDGDTAWCNESFAVFNSMVVTAAFMRVFMVLAMAMTLGETLAGDEDDEDDGSVEY